MPPLTAAQKRQKEKDKKKKQKELELIRQEHAEFDANNNSSPGAKKTIEQKLVNERLAAMGRVVVAVPSDGDCLYHALLQQKNSKEGRGGTANASEAAVAELRKLIADHIASHADEYEAFILDEDVSRTTSKCAANSPPPTVNVDEPTGKLQRYCAELIKSGVWGSLLEVRAASELFSVSIAVVKSDDIVTFGASAAADCAWCIAFYDHLYALGGHFNATRTSQEALEVAEEIGGDEE